MFYEIPRVSVFGYSPLGVIYRCYYACVYYVYVEMCVPIANITYAMYNSPIYSPNILHITCTVQDYDVYECCVILYTVYITVYI